MGHLDRTRRRTSDTSTTHLVLIGREETYRLVATKDSNSNTTPKDRITRVHSLRGCKVVEECPSICFYLPGLHCL